MNESTIKIEVTDPDPSQLDGYMRDGVKVVGICTFMKAFLRVNDRPATWDEKRKAGIDYNKESELFRSWMANHTDVHYFGAPREEFFVYKAVEGALEKGCVAVIVEDMS